MSGICAILRLDGAPAEAEALAPILAGMAARGPDRSAICSDGPAALGHALLATTPESVVEPMPLRHAETGCLISADVRLDNRDDLIATLGLDLAGRVIGDGELILEAYLKWGMDCPEHLLGDFAFVIWDPRHHRLFAARDKVGMRQLIYHFAPGKLLACATDAKPVLRHPDIPRQINEARVADFIEHMEAIDGTSTFYEGIFRLPPAHALRVESGALTVWRYWQLTPSPIIHRANDGEYTEQFLAVFTQAVQARLRAPSPVGSMLSGGMDSGSIVAVAARLLHEAGAPPLKTFSALHHDPNCEESKAVRTAMAMPHIDASMVSTASSDEFRDEVAEHIRNCAEPFDGHMAMVMAVYAKARRSGVNTMLDGVSGDTTISCGNIVAWHLAHGRFRQAWQEAQADERYWGHFRPARSQYFKQARRTLTPQPVRSAWQRLKPLLGRDDRNSPGLLDAEFARRVDFAARQKTFRDNVSVPDDWSPQTRAMRPLHPYALAGRERYDRVAGAFGIEPRDPYLDIRLIEFCLTLPVEKIKHDGWPKLILRRSMAGLMPDPLRWRTGRTHVGGWFIQACTASVVADDERIKPFLPYVDAGKLHRLRADCSADSALANLSELSYLSEWINRICRA